MKHQKKGRKFGRVRNQRKALIKSLAVALIDKGKIKTTLPKAKSLRPHIERLVTYAKKGVKEGAGFRLLGKFLPKASAEKILKNIAPKYEKRNGGYTRIIKLSPRLTDAAKMAYIEFI
ncbi:MAG: 50S ribosomal protein L17 [Patescibacteria group bacterium]